MCGGEKVLSNHINNLKSNIDKSYILKSGNQQEKYITKTKDGKYFPDALINAVIFQDKQQAEDVAQMLNTNGQQVSVLEIQDRTKW